MNTIRQFLAERNETLLEHWLERVMAAYPAEGAAFFTRRNDPFANPVGHTARDGTRRLLDALLTGDDPIRGSVPSPVPEEPADSPFHEPLREMLRVRAVQEMPPSAAVGFVLELKPLIRDLLHRAGPAAPSGDDPDARALARDLVVLEARIDRLALVAFDIYVEFREELAGLRIREMHRKVSWILDRLNGRAGDEAENARDAAAPSSPGEAAVRGGNGE